MELDSDSGVDQESSAKFGAHLGNQDTPIDTKKYILDFLQNILLQREKLDAGLLKDYLDADIAVVGQEILSSLESSNRKLLAVESGSLLFTLFCPTTSSIAQLTDDSWIKSLTLKMDNLAKKMGRYHYFRILSHFLTNALSNYAVKLKASEEKELNLKYIIST